MTTGRNQPCPCGSGKKYKQCCQKADPAPQEELRYQALCNARNRLMERILKYLRRTQGKAVMDSAMDEFWLWPEPGEEPDEDVFEQTLDLAIDWLMFNWAVDPADPESQEQSLHEDKTMAEVFVESRAGKLDPEERKLFEGFNRIPLSFFEVMAVRLGKGLTVKDILTGFQVDVHEVSATQNLSRGDILFGRVATVDGLGMLAGMATLIIPPEHKPRILELRQQMRSEEAQPTAETLEEWAIEIRDVYFELSDRLNRPMSLKNTHGHDIEYHHLVFGISSPEDVLDKLRRIKGIRVEEHVEGASEGVQCVWVDPKRSRHALLETTILGQIEIQGQRLLVDVNSAERAQTIRGILEARLKGRIRFLSDEVRSLDSVPPRSEEELALDREKQAELMRNPAVQAALAETLQKHWRSWIDIGIPALGGKTPRQAAKTPDGREAVEALLVQVERDQGQDPTLLKANREGSCWVRKKLGLNPPANKSGSKAKMSS